MSDKILKFTYKNKNFEAKILESQNDFISGKLEVKAVLLDGQDNIFSKKPNNKTILVFEDDKFKCLYVEKKDLEKTRKTRKEKSRNKKDKFTLKMF